MLNFLTSKDAKFIYLDLKVLVATAKVHRCETAETWTFYRGVPESGSWLVPYLTFRPPTWHCSSAPSPPSIPLPQFQAHSSSVDRSPAICLETWWHGLQPNPEDAIGFSATDSPLFHPR